MSSDDNLEAVLLDQHALSLEQLACACGVAPQWVVERVEAELLAASTLQDGALRFDGAALVRARRLLAAERVFDANPDAAGFIADLIEEVNRLKALLRHAADHETVAAGALYDCEATLMQVRR